MNEAHARFQGTIPEAYDRHLGGSYSRRTPSFPEDPPTFYQVRFGFHDPDVLKRLLADNGFVGIELEYVTRETRSPSAQSFAVGLVKGNPTTIQERNAPFEPIIDAVEAALKREGGDKPFRSTMRAIVFTAEAGGGGYKL